MGAGELKSFLIFNPSNHVNVPSPFPSPPFGGEGKGEGEIMGIGKRITGFVLIPLNGRTDIRFIRYH
jgi:hypothetical protein